MPQKKVLPAATPQSTDETPVPAVALRPKRYASAAKKPAAQLPKAASAKTPQPAGKSLRKKPTPVATPPATPPDTPPAATPAATPGTPPAAPTATSSPPPAGAKTSRRSPAKPSARSSARPATHTKTRKPARMKTTTLTPTSDQAPVAEPLQTDPLLPEQVVETSAPETASLENMTADKVGPATVPAPVVSDAELWEQGSPIRLRMAQLKTRNSLLEEQLQRLRPPFQVRGKKK